uniref:Uncharacterized protein n=1 Tax=Anguilla anguilla TaxID=7936 RepID=A0A0E9QDK7_ANGAN
MGEHSDHSIETVCNSKKINKGKCHNLTSKVYRTKRVQQLGIVLY